MIERESLQRVFKATLDFERRPRNAPVERSTYRPPVSTINYLRPITYPDMNGVQEAYFHEWDGTQFIQRDEMVYIKDVNGNALATDQLYIAFSSAPYSGSVLWFTDIGEPGSGSGGQAEFGDGAGDYADYIFDVCPIYEDIEVGASGSGNGTNELVGGPGIDITTVSDVTTIGIADGGIVRDMFADGAIGADQIEDGAAFKNGDFLYARQW